MMEKMIDVARGESSEYVTKQKYPHIAQMIASYNLGKSTKDKNLCKSLFPCKDDYSEDKVNLIGIQLFYRKFIIYAAYGPSCIYLLILGQTIFL